MLYLTIGKKIMQYCHCSFVDHRMTRITAYAFLLGKYTVSLTRIKWKESNQPSGRFVRDSMGVFQQRKHSRVLRGIHINSTERIFLHMTYNVHVQFKKFMKRFMRYHSRKSFVHPIFWVYSNHFTLEVLNTKIYTNSFVEHWFLRSLRKFSNPQHHNLHHVTQRLIVLYRSSVSCESKQYSAHLCTYWSFGFTVVTLLLKLQTQSITFLQLHNSCVYWNRVDLES